MKRTFIYIIFIICLFFHSCRKDDSDNFQGPSLNDLYGPFNILSPLELGDEVNFTSGENIAFNVEISKRTRWEIEITGATSGAKRTFTGNDRIISKDNALWKGGANTFPSFGLEKTYIKISFPDEEDAPLIMDSVNITGLKKDQGIIVTDFENGSSDSWDYFNQAGVSASIICNTDDAAKGSCFYSWDGSVPWDWAIGYLKINTPENGFGLPANANNLYFNIGAKFISNTGPNNCFLQLWFDEDDNGDGVYTASSEDQFIYEYWYENDKWNLVSFKYGDLKYNADGDLAETNGNGLPEPSKLIGVTVFFLANKESGIRSEATIDQLIFTENESYKP